MNKTQIDPQTKAAVSSFIEKIAMQYNLMGAILFGSRARHTHHQDSDADVAVLLRGHPAGFITTKLAMDDIAYDVLLETEILIRPLPIWEEQWSHPETYGNPRLLENIHREGIQLKI